MGKKNNFRTWSMLAVIASVSMLPSIVCMVLGYCYHIAWSVRWFPSLVKLTVPFGSDYLIQILSSQDCRLGRSILLGVLCIPFDAGIGVWLFMFMSLCRLMKRINDQDNRKMIHAIIRRTEMAIVLLCAVLAVLLSGWIYHKIDRQNKIESTKIDAKVIRNSIINYINAHEIIGQNASGEYVVKIDKEIPLELPYPTTRLDQWGCPFRIRVLFFCKLLYIEVRSLGPDIPWNSQDDICMIYCENVETKEKTVSDNSIMQIDDMLRIMPVDDLSKFFLLQDK